jgi:prolyl-tRNA synthetase
MTHEETFTFHGREIQSYRELPQFWYHFGTKERDEPRPHGGLIRVREFVMKDSYSFDRDEAGLDESFQRHAAAYRRIFDRCGLDYYEVEAEPGMMGGSESWDYLCPAGSGQDMLALCENGDFAADAEVARAIPPRPDFPERLDAPQEVETPGVTTIDALAEFLGIDPRATSKAMPVVTDGGPLVLALVRGDDRLHDVKLEAALERSFRPAEEDEIRRTFGAGGGSIGPVGVSVEVVADEALREGSSWPARTATAGTCAGSRQAATTSPASPTSARCTRATAARTAAARCGFTSRSRSGTSSSSGRGSRRRSARRSSTRTAGSGRS